MCNLYALTSGPDAIRAIARAMRDETGNLAPLPAIFPDGMAPVVANRDGARVLTRMRWGMPSPAFALKAGLDGFCKMVCGGGPPHHGKAEAAGRQCLTPPSP